MLSLRQSLAKIGKQPPIRIPTDFQTCPKSLGEIVRILNLPKRDIDTLQHNCVHSFTEENAQGLVYAHDEVWFLSSQDNIFKYAIEGQDLYNPTEVHRLLKVSRDELVKAVGLNKNHYKHMGDLGYLNGMLIAPLEHTDHAHVLLLALNDDLDVIGYSTVPKQTGDAWCAFNSWNGLLYLSQRDSEGHLQALDVSGFFQLLDHPDQYGSLVDTPYVEGRDLVLKGENGIPDHIEGIQGLTFSQDGCLYLTWWYCRTRFTGPFWDECVDYANHLRIYNALTGMRLGDREYDFSGAYDEIEGISIHPSGVLYIAVAENDVWDSDEFDICAVR